LAHGDTIVDREWNFASAADVRFVMQDTLAISVHFPDKIPDDRLIGYTRFRIVVSDSNAGMSIAGGAFLYRIQFDAGFLYFDHALIFEMNYRSGLLRDTIANPARFALYLDPFPASHLHDWFPVQTFSVDTAAGVVRFTYNHPRYSAAPAKKAGLARAMIASSGYPFEYGLFLMDSTSAIMPPREDRFRIGQWLISNSDYRTGRIFVIDVQGRLLPAYFDRAAVGIIGDAATGANGKKRVIISGKQMPDSHRALPE
jgi:hypothetical protein